MADVIDIDAEETPVTRGMRRREARKAAAKEKGTSRILWIIVGSLATVLTFRAMDAYFPRQPQALPPPPPPTPEI